MNDDHGFIHFETYHSVINIRFIDPTIMAKISYKGSIADYVIIRFKCNCEKEITTNLIPVKERYASNKDINSFDYSDIQCPKCNKKHIIHFYDNMFESYCEINSITSDENIIYLHEIPYEYAKDYDNSLIDYIQEINKFKENVEKIDKQKTFDKDFLRRMFYLNIISVMDAYLHNTFLYNVNKHDIFKQAFLVNCNRQSIKTTWEMQLKKISSTSFQNLEQVTIPYYKGTFGIKIDSDCIIQNAVQIRNAIVHNNGRGKDGYLYEISDLDIKELISHVKTLVRFVNIEMLGAVFEKIIWLQYNKVVE